MASTSTLRSNSKLLQVAPSCAEADAVCCCQMGVWRQKGNSQRHHEGLVQLRGRIFNLWSRRSRRSRGDSIDRPHHLIIFIYCSCKSGQYIPTLCHMPNMSAVLSHILKHVQTQQHFELEKIRRRLEASKLRLCARLEASLETPSRRP